MQEIAFFILWSPVYLRTQTLLYCLLEGNVKWILETLIEGMPPPCLEPHPLGSPLTEHALPQTHKTICIANHVMAFQGVECVGHNTEQEGGYLNTSNLQKTNGPNVLWPFKKQKPNGRKISIPIPGIVGPATTNLNLKMITLQTSHLTRVLTQENCRRHQP